MLFNSYTFLFCFLPPVLCCFYLLRQFRLRKLAFLFLAIASLVFYGWWSLRGLLLLVVLMSANYAFVWLLLGSRIKRASARRAVVITAIVLNLGVLGYFKYANFFIENWNALTRDNVPTLAIVLPLGLSFFTFQKIALLVDAYGGRVRQFDPVGYALFVSFFPQLIAGPIVHHSEVMPQFARSEGPDALQIAEGLSVFAIGLSKKVLGADSLSGWVAPVFDAASPLNMPTFTEAWLATLAYSLQLYLDFAGYSDMAIGLGLLFGVRLPVNFNSPYKATSIVDFWRRWHMTLSRFLRDYLYIPLGGNRLGPPRRYVNLMITMVLGGFWHGAAWTFVIWGALHGIYLIVNHGWTRLAEHWFGKRSSTLLSRGLARSLTFLAVMAGWVFFRAPDLQSAASVLAAMLGRGGSGVSTLDAAHATAFILPLLLLAWFAPNSQEIATRMFASNPATAKLVPAWQWATATGALLALCLMGMTRVSEFLYFQF